ncbi:hypothetical protein HK102_014106 [Quaeritorhiza haematococci]|nr:hypothetical protein HK102_014106 [Quaeritorhiza haematococci]
MRAPVRTNVKHIVVAIFVSVALSILLSALMAESQPQSVELVRNWQRWCGKHYEPGAPPDMAPDPDPVPLDPQPPIRLLVRPRVQPYTTEVAGSLLVEVQISGDAAMSVEGGQQPQLESLQEQTAESWWFEAVNDETGKVVVGSTPIPMTGLVEISLVFEEDSSTVFPTRMEPFKLRCRITKHKNASAPEAETTALLYRLPPNPWGGSVVKLDSWHGSLLVEKPGAAAKGSRPSSPNGVPVLPFGYYNGWGGWMSEDLTLIDKIKDEGFTMMHPVPPFDESMDLIEKAIDRAGEIGLYVHYDMRHTYRDVAAVREQVLRFRGKPAILSWYTGDEPDGHGDDPALAQAAYATIKQLDPYRPVSLVLNCANYGFHAYSQGTDILMTDVYPVGINPKWSVYGTECTPTFGCCGCDNCDGSLMDIARRLDMYRERMRKPMVIVRQDGEGKGVGMERNGVWDLPLWHVNQAFGKELHWSRIPTPAEERVMIYLSLMHQSKGILFWLQPTDPQLHAEIATVAREVKAMSPYLLHSSFNAMPFDHHSTTNTTTSTATEVDIVALPYSLRQHNGIAEQSEEGILLLVASIATSIRDVNASGRITCSSHLTNPAIPVSAHAALQKRQQIPMIASFEGVAEDFARNVIWESEILFSSGEGTQIETVVEFDGTNGNVVVEVKGRVGALGTAAVLMRRKTGD